MSFLVNATTALATQSLGILVLKQTSISFIIENNLNLKWGITTYGKLRAKVVLFDKI